VYSILEQTDSHRDKGRKERN